jgi:hypothetical protein
MGDQTKLDVNDEIEMSVFINSIKRLFVGILKLIFHALSFYKKYIVVVLILAIGGGIGGYYMDNNNLKNYRNDVIVIPNFESTEYLYDAIEMVNSKIKNKDGLFFSKIKIDDYLVLREITIKPVTDVYDMVKQQKSNLDVFKIMSEKGDMSKVLADLTTGRHFKFHKISIYEKGSSYGNKNIKALLDFLNDNAYYKTYGKVLRESQAKKIEKNNEMIAQIDSLLSAVGKIKAGASSDSKISINQNTQLNDLVLTKESLIMDNRKIQLDLIDNQNVIQEVSTVNDIIEDRILSYKTMMLPLLLLMAFSSVFFLRYLFNKLKSVTAN